MSETRDQAAAVPPEPGSFFRLRPHRPFAAIVVILSFLGLLGLAFGALFGTELDVEPFIPDAPERVSVRVGEAIGAPGSGSVLGSSLPQAAPTGAGETQPPPIGQDSERTVRFGPHDAGVLTVPEGWKFARAGGVITLSDGGGVRFSAQILTETAMTPATQLVAEAQTEILSPLLAAHVRTSDVVGLQPFASLVTRSLVAYSALRTDAQGLASIAGNTFAYVRGDGLALIVNAEVTPAAAWQETRADWLPLWLSVVSNFAGSSPLG